MTAEKSAGFLMSQIYELGRVTVFYIPSHKLHDPRYQASGRLGTTKPNNRTLAHGG